MDEREREVRRRMAQHELYTDSGPGLEALEEERVAAKELVHDFNRTRPREVAERQRLLRELLGTMGQRVWVEPPLHVAYGSNVHFGDDVYVNFGLTVVDDGEVHVGDRAMFAPHVTITATGHPVHPELRRDGTQFSAPVRIEDDVWIGAGAVLLAGVTVGQGSVVGAGSVVARMSHRTSLSRVSLRGSSGISLMAIESSATARPATFPTEQSPARDVPFAET